MQVLNTTQAAWHDELVRILERSRHTSAEVEQRVREIIEKVRTEGDAALFEYTRTFDGFDPEKEGLFFTVDDMEEAINEVDPDLLAALEVAAERIEAFHEHEREDSWIVTEPDGTILGQKVTPVRSAGIYIPGGKNAFPSTVLMNVIPATIAGVRELTIVTPTPGGRVSPALLAAAHIAGVERICRIGGAQAVAALACGTESVPRVDKVVGPGNVYVATAKRLLQGTIGIDSIAGPSEVLVIADGSVAPELAAIDLLSQAEHDANASAILLTPDADYAHAVLAHIERELETLPRTDVIRASLRDHGACVVTRDLEEAVNVANEVAPEHLELLVANPQEWLGAIENAGAIFLGENSPEAIGDYVAGPNHTLPTGSTARFYSPLGVYDFCKRSSIIGFSRRATLAHGPHAVTVARAEELEAHARSVEYRLR